MQAKVRRPPLPRFRLLLGLLETGRNVSRLTCTRLAWKFLAKFLAPPFCSPSTRVRSSPLGMGVFASMAACFPQHSLPTSLCESCRGPRSDRAMEGLTRCCVARPSSAAAGPRPIRTSLRPVGHLPFFLQKVSLQLQPSISSQPQPYAILPPP